VWLGVGAGVFEHETTSQPDVQVRHGHGTGCPKGKVKLQRASLTNVDAQPVLDLIAAARPSRGITFVGIGGRGGAGKSTLAARIEGAQIVSTDEFWDGEGFELSRLRAEVFEPLLAGRAARYAAWDWDARRPGPLRTIEPRDVVVVEGVCALHRMFRDDYDVRVWVEAPYETRLARGVARDGEAARRIWVEHWMPMEDRYVARDDPVACAHLVVDGSRPLETPS
jgi:uridine kinase